jgi:DNA-binding IclR family transcriptional regulator
VLRSARRIGPVLNMFTREQPSWGASEVAEKMGISRGSAHQLLTSMATIGLLHTSGRGRYWVGRKIQDLSDALLCTVDVHRAALTPMHALRGLTAETVQLAAPDGTRALYVDKLVGNQAVYVDSPEAGDTVELLMIYGTAALELSFSTRDLAIGQRSAGVVTVGFLPLSVLD